RPPPGPPLSPYTTLFRSQLVATGYNRNHLSTSEGGAIEAEAEMRNTADRIDTTAAVWMGLTANCASCHDHKFDPLTQREYYSLRSEEHTSELQSRENLVC